MQEIDTRTLPGFGRSVTLWQDDDALVVSLEGAGSRSYVTEADAWHAWLHPFAAGFTLDEAIDLDTEIEDEQIEDLAERISEYTEGGVSLLTLNIEQLLALLAEVLRDPGLTASDFRWVNEQCAQVIAHIRRERGFGY